MRRLNVVLLHGAGGTAASWKPVLGHWEWARVWTPDLPGRAAVPGPALDRAVLAARWLVDRLPEEPSVLVGHSYGGAVALQVALDWPGRVRGLVLVSSAARLRVHPAILAAVAASTPQQPYRLDVGFGPGTRPVVIERYAEVTAGVPTATALADWRACDTFDVRHRLGEVTVPTLVVHGSEDFLTPAKHQARLAEALPDAQRVAVDGRGHMLPWEDPGVVSGAVRGWLEGMA